MPKISVVMPAYNSEKYIAEAIDSILKQTYTDFEFIIINDGSTDKTEEIILSFNDKRIVYLKNEKNSGIVYTLNRGLDAAKGEYIARMDSDDISLPKRFEEQLNFLQKHSNFAVLGTSFEIFGEGIQKRYFPYSKNCKKAKAELFFNSSLGHPSVMIRKSIIDDNNLRYEEEYRGLEDFVFWWRLAKFGEMASLKKPLLKYRKHATQITAVRNVDFEDKFRNFLCERINMFSKNFTKNEIDALFKYCTDNSGNFLVEELNNIISVFKKILKSNLDIQFFNNYYLKQVFSLALTYCINSLDCGEKQKLNYFKYVFKEKVLSFNIFIKVIIHKILKH